MKEDAGEDRGGPYGVSEVTDQLADELSAAVIPLAGIAGDPAPMEWPEALARQAPALAHQLCCDDKRESSEAVIGVMNALWPADSPELVGQPEWWRTPLGRACAHALDPHDTSGVTYAVAAGILGVTVGTIKQLAHRGSLAKSPDGITRASVFARMERLLKADSRTS